MSGSAARAGLLGTVVLGVVLVAGLSWAKWLPYAAKTRVIVDGGSWPGEPLFDVSGASGSGLAGVWDFATAYFAVVWPALVVAVLVAAAVDSLMPRRWLMAVLARRTRVGQATAGGLLATTSMMCTCCTAPVTVGLRRRGVPLAAIVAHWIGNPLLNPAVLVFLVLVLPWPYAAVRLVVSVGLVLGVGAVVGRFAGRADGATASEAPASSMADAETVGELPRRFLRSLRRLVVVLVPEYLLLVLGVGLLISEGGGRLVPEERGVLAAVLVVLAAMAVVIPTGGEIPLIVAATAAGAPVALSGVLLIALPALSVPSMAMVGRALGWRATATVAAAVAAASVVAGGVLAVSGAV